MDNTNSNSFFDDSSEIEFTEELNEIIQPSSALLSEIKSLSALRKTRITDATEYVNRCLIAAIRHFKKQNENKITFTINETQCFLDSSYRNNVLFGKGDFVFTKKDFELVYPIIVSQCNITDNISIQSEKSNSNNSTEYTLTIAYTDFDTEDLDLD